jgi:transmembrane E3 ubiquitin-protein ligase
LILITELKNFTITESGIRIEFKDVIVQKHFLRLFTRLGDSICKANIVMDFTQKENNVMQGSLIFESLQSSCLPHEIKITLEYPFDSLISSKRVMNYTLIVFMMLWFYCYSMIRQIKKVEENEQIAKRMSITMIGWNIVWNFSLFNIYFTYSVARPEYTQLMAPAFFYFMIWFLFELKLLLLCWKANNMRVINEGTNAARRALIFFYVKFYCVWLATVILIDTIFAYRILLLITNGLIWVPQILKNATNKARNVPDTKFIISLTMTQCFLPIYMRGCSDNQFLTRPDQQWWILFISVLLAQITILILQKKIGSRFFLPEKYRYWNEYNYYRNLEEADVEEGETECCICLNLLSYIETDAATHNPRRMFYQYQRIVFMQTPCAHKFHSNCLKPWMRQKLECPKCRAELPPLDEEEY